MIDVNVLGVAHQADERFIKYIWWYSILEGRMEGYSQKEVEKHTSSKFSFTNNDYDKCARGKVILFGGKYYLLIWTPGYRRYNDDILQSIVNKIEKIFNIDYVIDESAKDLLESL